MKIPTRLDTVLQNSALLLGIALFWSGIATTHAQTPIFGNTPQTNDLTSSAGLNALRQKGLVFTVGASPLLLNRVDLRLGNYSTTGGDVASIGIYADIGSTATYGAQVGTDFTAPASSGTGIQMFSFTHAGIALAAGTKYWLVARATTGDYSWYASDPGITPTGSAATFNGAYFTSGGNGAFAVSAILNTFAFFSTSGPPAPVTSAFSDVVTGAGAPNAAGADSGADFDVLKRGGALAENGHLVFPGTLLVGTGGVTPSTSMGLWKKGAGNLNLLARSGDVAPETTGATYDVLPTIPAINDSGEVTFLASLLVGSGGTTADTDTGLWSELGGTGLGMLMREGDTIPPLAPVQVGSFASGAYATANTSPSTGEAVFSITMKNGSTDSAILRASIAGPSVTAVQVLARENTVMPGVAGELFGPLASSYSDPAHMDATGNVVFGAVSKTNKESIWYQPVAPAGGPAAKVFITGEVAPGTGGATFLSLKSATIGGGGVINFRGFLNANTGDNVGNLKNDGIWRGTGSNAAGYLCILRRGDSGLPGMPALPAKVGNLWHSWLTNGNRGAWLGWLDLNGDGSSSTAAGDVNAIYTDLSGTMSMLIKAGDPAPGIAGATMASFDLPIVGGAQQAVFLGKLTLGGAITAANNGGVWRTAANGGPLVLLLRTGDTMTTTQGVKTVQKIDFPGSNSTQRRWEQPVMDSTGRTLLFVTFTDGATTQVLVP